MGEPDDRVVAAAARMYSAREEAKAQLRAIAERRADARKQIDLANDDLVKLANELSLRKSFSMQEIAELGGLTRTALYSLMKTRNAKVHDAEAMKDAIRLYKAKARPR